MTIKRPIHRDRRPMARRGSVLIVALVVLFALAGLVLAMGRTAHTDSALAANNRGTHQADAIERGAEQYVVALLTNYKDSLSTLTDTDFQQVPVGDGYFWIIRPNYNDNTLPSFGLMDETAKLDINRARLEILRNLPGMTNELAGAIVDWRDTDDTVSENGAESPDYMGIAESYRAKNGPFEAVEELLLIKGMTRELFYGTGGAVQAQAFENNYYQTNGLHEFFTCWTGVSTATSDGTQRVDISGNGQEVRDRRRTVLTDRLSRQRADEITGRLGNTNVRDIFQLAQLGELTQQELETIEPYVTSGPATAMRVNVNTAPREVLLSLVGETGQLTEADVDSLLSQRATRAATDTPTMAWVYEALKERSQGLGRVICAEGNFYSADIVAVGRAGRAFKRVRIVVDSSQSPARIVYRRDLTDMGWPLDRSILDQLRSGQQLATIETDGSRTSFGGGTR